MDEKQQYLTFFLNNKEGAIVIYI